MTEKSSHTMDDDELCALLGYGRNGTLSATDLCRRSGISSPVELHERISLLAFKRHLPIICRNDRYFIAKTKADFEQLMRYGSGLKEYR